jgi:hypothetical protein
MLFPESEDLTAIGMSYGFMNSWQHAEALIDPPRFPDVIVCKMSWAFLFSPCYPILSLLDEVSNPFRGISFMLILYYLVQHNQSFCIQDARNLFS